MVSVAPIGRMEPYSPEHLLVVVVAAAGVILLPWAVRRGVIGDREVRAAGWVLLAFSVAWTVWGLIPAHFNPQASLPFHLSDWLRYITSFALITRAAWAVVVGYYWGLTLNLQAILTPDLVYWQHPVPEFVMFWVLHVGVFVVPVMFVWGFGHRPTWRGYVVGFAVTLVWAATAMTVNAMLDANYGFLAEAPQVASVLDYMGEWPWYVVWIGLLLAVVWALMTWPWTTHRATVDTVPDPTGLIRTPAPGGALRGRRPRRQGRGRHHQHQHRVERDQEAP